MRKAIGDIRASRRVGLTLIELLVVLTVLVALGALLIPNLVGLTDEAEETVTRTNLNVVRDALLGPGRYVEDMKHQEQEGAAGLIGEGSGLPWASASLLAAEGRASHPQLHFLFETPFVNPAIGEFDPASNIGWRSPGYLEASVARTYPEPDEAAQWNLGAEDRGFGDTFGVPGDLTPVDGWGNPIVLQLPDVIAGVDDEEVRHARLVSAGENGRIDTPADTLMPTSRGDDLVLFLFVGDN